MPAQGGIFRQAVDLVALGNALWVGANEILIVAQNGGVGPNPAGLFFEARLRSTDNAYRSVVSDKSWDWTPAKPNAQGVLAAAGVEWKSASEVEHQDRWASAVTPDSVARLFRDQSQGGRMVRASLVKLDALMRSLGRPNRDQIVTMRPSELTTLEAIDLANAQTLADALTSGAQKMLRESPNGKPNPDQLVRHLFRSAVAREPTSDEFAEARAMLGDVPSAAAIEDLLWSVFILPEFQLVR